MKKWYYWFILSAVFAAGGIINYIDKKQIIGQIIQVILTVLLAFLQLICDKNGEKGKRIFRYIGIGLIALLIIWIIIMLIK